MSVLGSALVILAAAMILCAVWRWAALPCPWWLVPVLENPYFQRVAGAELLMDRAGIRPGMAVLDAGCGPGRITVPAARRIGPQGSVLAVDVQPRMLARLERRLDEQGIGNVRIVHGALGDVELPPASFDVALLVTVLGELPDKLEALHAIGRSLKDGGVLSVTEVLPDPHYQTLSYVRDLARRAGFAEAALFRTRVGYTVNLVRDG